jgi:hypothetical protein
LQNLLFLLLELWKESTSFRGQEVEFMSMKGKEALRAASQADVEREQQRKTALLKSPITEEYQLSSASLYYYTPPPLEKTKIEKDSRKIFESAILSRLKREVDEDDDIEEKMEDFSSVRKLLPFGLKKLRYSKMWNMKSRGNQNAIPDIAYDLMDYIKDNGESVDLKLSKEEVYDLFAIGCLAEIAGGYSSDLTHEVIHRIITEFGYSNACEALAEEIRKDVPGDRYFFLYFDWLKLMLAIILPYNCFLYR